MTDQTSQDRAVRCLTQRSTSARAIASASHSSSRSSITTPDSSSMTTCRTCAARTQSKQAWSTTGSAQFKHSSVSPTAATSSIRPTASLITCEIRNMWSARTERHRRPAPARTEPAVFAQDSWQATPNLNVQYGLRWEAQLEPDPITPPDQVFYAPFIGKTVKGQEFPSNGKIPSDRKMWQPRLGIAWMPSGHPNSVLRANAGIYYGRLPGLTLASSRSTNGTRGQTLFRNSALTGILGPVPAYPNLIPQSQIGAPFLPDVFVFDRHFQNPRTKAASISWEQEVISDFAALVKYNYAKGDHITRFINRNDPLLGSPWGTGLPPGGANGINTLTTVESSARSLYNGVTLGLTKRPSHRMQFQVFYTYSKDKSDDDNERDPFTFRYAKVTDLAAEYGYSDRDQRHRVNSWLLWNAPAGLDVNFRYSYRSAQPKSITATGAVANTPQDRINPDGSVTRRNLGRKDNQFSSLDARISKPFALHGVTIEPAVDAFNLFNSKNLKRPEVTNLIFNFDGTVQSGLGDPRQAQVALRVLW